MESRTKVVSVQLEDGTSFKINASVIGGETDVVDIQKILPFKQVTDTIEGVAKSMLATLNKVEPNKASIEFGVEIALEAGGLTALIAKGTGTANLKITLEWEKQPSK
jgi:Trypsin-co-occurring domain 1